MLDMPAIRQEEPRAAGLAPAVDVDALLRMGVSEEDLLAEGLFDDDIFDDDLIDDEKLLLLLGGDASQL